MRSLKAQSVSRVDVLQARVEADTAAIQREQAHNAYLAAWRRLTAVAGLPSLEPRPLMATCRTACRSSIGRRRLSGCKRAVPSLPPLPRGPRRRSCAQRAGVEACPNVMLEIGAQHSNESGDNVLNVTAGVPVPLFNRNQGNIRKAEGELAAAEAEMNRVRFDLQNRLATAFERYAKRENKRSGTNNASFPTPRPRSIWSRLVTVKANSTIRPCSPRSGLTFRRTWPSPTHARAARVGRVD